MTTTSGEDARDDELCTFVPRCHTTPWWREETDWWAGFAAEMATGHNPADSGGDDRTKEPS